MDDENVRWFENRRVRTTWDEEKQELFFSIVDICAVLTEQSTQRGASNYWAKQKERLSEEGVNELLTNCHQLKMLASDGKMRLTDVANIEQIFRIIQSVPSKKTEQFKQWLESIENETTLPSIEKKGEMILYQPDNSIKLEVLVEDETVWLNRQQIAVLFERDVKTISKHINNSLSEELSGLTSVAKFATHLPDGRMFNVEYFNLDVVLSVGYRVKSKRGIQFRQWANSVLRDYIIKGYALNQRFERLEYRMTNAEEKIGLLVSTSLLPAQGVYSEGQIFQAYNFVSDLIRSAKESIMLLDNYVDDSVLLILSKREPNVSADIYTRRISPELKLDIDKFNTQYPPVYVHESDGFHDRFLIIDHVVYHIGSSIKDLGKKMFAFSKIEISDRKILDDL